VNPLMGAFPNPRPDPVSIMSFTPPPTQAERRMKAGQLLEAVIHETLEPRMAINRWPESGDLPDLSLDCAYVALWHFEADEFQQQTELFYMDAQLELLRQIAEHLKAGRDLPPHMLRTYTPTTSPVRFFYARSVWADTQHILTAFWSQIKAIFEQAFQLLNFPTGK
jgi:hypothetical protein